MTDLLLGRLCSAVLNRMEGIVDWKRVAFDGISGRAKAVRQHEPFGWVWPIGQTRHRPLSASLRGEWPPPGRVPGVGVVVGVDPGVAARDAAHEPW